MQYPKTRHTLMSLAVASACAAATQGYAQETPRVAAAGEDQPVQSIVVTGLRQSLASSMNLKRNSDGVVDGIVAEDIGKFPDTNLAESLQRISGVSIDRSIGEGSKITVRGVGPDFNLVLLNGRQMPTSNLGDLNGRAFDFANLASEAISQLQVYKTSRAENATGGIGATINVMTAKPLDRPGLHASIGAKGVYDTSNDTLPKDVQASKSLTPEVSGIYSNTFANNTFGIALTGSYQERNLGYNNAAVSNGWKGPFRGDENNWGTIPQGPSADCPQCTITNRPTGSQLYSVPQNLNYNFNGVKRQRTNAQLTLQYKPVDTLVTTLDYTYSENKIQTKRNDISAWFNFGPSSSAWTQGSPSSPLMYKEFVSNSDIAMGAADFATKTQNKSLGFNAVWKPTNTLRLELDAHHSTAESGADSPFGSSNTLGTASFSRGNTTADFSHDFPVLSIDGADFVGKPQQVTGSVFTNSYMRGEVEQFQTKGAWKVLEASELKFGLNYTKVDNRSAFSNNQRDTWGGATKPSDYPSSLWHQDTLRQYFDKIDGSNSSALFNQFYTFNFNQVRQAAAAASGLPNMYLPKNYFDNDARTEEKSKALYLQFNTDWDTVLPIHTAFGVRYEKTDVVSTALVPAATKITWVSQNEFPITFGDPTFTTLTGRYHNLLPSFDSDVDLTPNQKLRFSYGETIGRPRWDQIQGGTTLNSLVRTDGGTGSQGNPALKPVKSKNFDLSYEWYYGEQNFVSLGLFKKNLENYAGQSRIIATPFNLHTPVGGALWNEAIAKSCANTDTTCIRNYIFTNHPTAPGVTPPGVNGDVNGSIVGQPSDPVAQFQITSFSNQKKASLNGAEINLQHMFGNSGFGISTNYTYVHSGLRYDNNAVGEQFALVGLSNSYNVVGIFENKKWTGRLAYNWRGEFLSSTFDGAGPNPQYVEPYGQLDLSISYNYNDKLSFQFEGINLTDEIQRVHSRTKQQLESVTQAGPRYMIGARYKF
ncbi:TonB-dependent receptor [Duganella callida]|uniref:TonB-dependent receptor n=1 Tax=Duganella callida TaxID=2561932 RepID=A0A4Y9SHN5_9BURK|nr:TonB-dependent receptor [Duganella callida]TFW24341.1 TonB-dependent receptor [Duganella callida]